MSRSALRGLVIGALAAGALASTNALAADCPPDKVGADVLFFQAEDGIGDDLVIGVQTCALPICLSVFGMGVEFGGAIDVDAHLQLSYDTLGLREMVNDIASGNTSKIPDDIKDGYYITPDSH